MVLFFYLRFRIGPLPPGIAFARALFDMCFHFRRAFTKFLLAAARAFFVIRFFCGAYSILFDIWSLKIFTGLGRMLSSIRCTICCLYV